MKNPSIDIKELFATSLEYEGAEERERYLDDACQGDPDLRAQIDDLLAAHVEAGSFLASPLLESDITMTRSPGPLAEGPGTTIGRYKLLQEIGEGGFGIVYMAEQQRPVHRRVALKIIKAGLATRQVIGRFEAERQALAMMDHPNIAKVLDAGATDSGRPYFVMELVKGIPITEYCDQNNLNTRQRLDLFISVCHAVQHAHQKGVIHRDLKPSNVMVTLHDGVPVPKVIDFGIAKATQQRLTDKTVFTEFQQMIGTPEYMSPEQAEMSGLDVDTRSDIYSLGVLLYELLTGTTPFVGSTLRSAALHEIRRMIREDEPPRPSTRVNTLATHLRRQSIVEDSRVSDVRQIARRRCTDPVGLGRLLRGDLDWVVMKALEKDRTRRYDTANTFAADIQRYLNDEPVLAGPPSTLYKLRKFGRRNRRAVLAGGAVVAALLIGVTVAVIGFVKAELALDREQLAREEAERNARVAVQARRQMRRSLYRADMQLAFQAWEDANPPRVLELLRRHDASESEEDLRGFDWYYLWKRCERSVTTPTLPQTERIICMALSPDGTMLALGGGSGPRSIRFWDLVRNVEVASIPSAEMVLSASFSPDGKMLATGHYRKGVRLWDARTRTLLDHLPHDVGFGPSLAFSPDGDLLASGGGNGVVQLWNMKTRAPAGVLAGLHKTNAVWGVAFSNNGQRLATSGGDNTVALWDLDQREPIWKRTDHTDIVSSVAFASDGRTLATGSRDETIRLRDPATGETRKTLPGHANQIVIIRFSPDGDTLASGSRDNTVKLWDVESGSLKDTLIGHESRVWSVAFSPDGRTLLSGGEDGRVKRWDLARRPLPDTLEVVDDDDWGNASLAVLSDGMTIATATRSAPVVLWDAKTLDELGRIGTPIAAVRRVAASPTEPVVAITAGDGAVEIWNPHEPTTLVDVIKAEASTPSVLAFSADGRLLAIGGEDGSLIVRDARTREIHQSLEGHAGKVFRLAFSPDGRTLASSSWEDGLKIWNLDTGRPLTRFAEQNVMADAIAFSPDGETLAGAYFDTVTLYNFASARARQVLSGHSGRVACLTFSPNGNVIATGDEDRTVKLWNLDQGDVRATFVGHDDVVSRVAFSPDGRILYSQSRGTVKLWRAATEEQVRAVNW